MPESHIKKSGQRLVMVRMMLDVLRTIHMHHAPPGEPFGARVETMAVALCVAVGDLEDKPFTAAKIAHYIGMPRATVTRRLDRLERKYGVVEKRGSRYHLHAAHFNTAKSMRSYYDVRRLIHEMQRNLSIMDSPVIDAVDAIPQEKRAGAKTAARVEALW